MQCRFVSSLQLAAFSGHAVQDADLAFVILILHKHDYTFKTSDPCRLWHSVTYAIFSPSELNSGAYVRSVRFS